MKDYIFTFNTQLDAVIAKKYCEKNNIKCKLAPVPRCLSSSCGTCAFIYTDNINNLKSLTFEEVYINQNGGYLKI